MTKTKTTTRRIYIVLNIFEDFALIPPELQSGKIYKTRKDVRVSF